MVDTQLIMAVQLQKDSREAHLQIGGAVMQLSLHHDERQYANALIEARKKLVNCTESIDFILKSL